MGICVEKGVVDYSVGMFCLLLAEKCKGTCLVFALESDKSLRGGQEVEIGILNGITSVILWPTGW